MLLKNTDGYRYTPFDLTGKNWVFTIWISGHDTRGGIMKRVLGCMLGAMEKA
jgi:hypothetical protein